MVWAAFGRIVGGASRAYAFGKAVKGMTNLDPGSIMKDASDPDVPAEEVLARGAARSRTGSLVRAAEEAIARRPSTIERIFGS